MKQPIKPNCTKNSDGFMTVSLLGIIVVFTIIMIAALQMITLNSRTVSNNITSQRSFNIAEAGINYYLWHLSHNPTDFKDGKTTPATPDPQFGYGPYVHDYYDDNQIKQGTYTLWIKPQGNGSTIATIRAIGRTNKSNITRTIEAQIGSPSFANYSVASDLALWFGDTESANGPVHSNQGVRMDGASSSDVTSANATYVPPGSYGGDGASHPGVWCKNTIITPVNCNTRPKVDWRFPVPSVDFNQLSGDICKIKKAAFLDFPATVSIAGQANACTQTPTTRTNSYLPQRSTSGSYSNTKGYLIELNANDTYNLWQVDAENERSSSYSTALTKVSLGSNIPLPPSKVIFAEDNVWIRSNSVFAGRLTIAAGRLASSSNAQINIVGQVLYSTKNGSDALGLIAEGDVLIAPYAPPATGNFDFEIDAAAISQNGSVKHAGYLKSNSSYCTKGWVNPGQTLKYYGAVASRQNWTWLYIRGGGGGSCGDNVYSSAKGYYVSGVMNNITEYDYNLMYAPPPFFPITGSYNILSWHEVVTTP